MITEEFYEVRLALCESRHAMPAEVTGSVFGETIADPTDTDELLHTATQRILSHVRPGHGGHIYLYVTGLTVALGAVIRACLNHAVHLTLMHYDRESGEYYPQYIC